MKGIILAGDSGTKLHPITLGVPKQLLPIYDKPMIYYPIHTLYNAGVEDILVITTSKNQSLFRDYTDHFNTNDISFTYACQEDAAGVAQALSIGESFIGNEGVCLITGDTIIVGNEFSDQLRKAINAADKSGNATIFVERDSDPEQYGKVLIDERGRMGNVVGDSGENNYYSITGVYVYPHDVVDIVKSIPLSERNRLEITSVTQIFQNRNKLQIQRLASTCQWFDTNTFDNLLRCGIYMQQNKKGHM